MKTKKEFFEFEKQTRKIFDDYYKRRGLKCKRIIGKDNKNYDCEILLDDKWYKIEEKYRSLDFDDCLIETIQDTKTNSLGWLYYSKADYIFYGVKNKIYCIDLPKLKRFIEKHKDIFNKKISKKGWGITENIVIDWSTLEINKIAKRIR